MGAVSSVRRLVSHESSNDQEGLIAASTRVTNKLGQRLSKIIGLEGYRTLLTRAVKLTALQHPTFATVSVAVDGALFVPATTTVSDEEAYIALVEHTFELLTTFIGDDLTLRMVFAVWPDFPLYAEDGKEAELP
jgi:Asp/Glu/hydantoin racemase